MQKQLAPKVILFISLVIIMSGFGIAIPLMPFYVTHFGASGRSLGLMMSLYSFMQFICAPFWGRLSDRVGRKPVLLFGIVGFFSFFLLQGMAQNLVMLIVFRALAGMLTSATLPTAMAYIVDITSEEERANGVGLMGAAIGTGMIIGPMFGGMLTDLSLPLPPGLASLLQVTYDAATGKWINLSIPFFASSLLALAAVPFIIVMLPESLTAERRVNLPMSAGESRVKLLTAGLRGPIGFLYFMAFLMAFALANTEGILGLYGKESFSMTPSEIGLMMGVIGAMAVIFQGVVIGPLTKKIGEIRVVRGGLVISVLGFALMALAINKWTLIAAVMVFNTGSVLLQPSVTALISKRAAGGQGVAMGLNNSFQSLGRGIGPLWAGSAYDIHHTLSFWSGAVIQVIALLYSIRMLGSDRPAVSPLQQPAASSND